MNFGNIDYHQSVAERHPNLVFKSAHLKDLQYVDTFNISGVDGGKDTEQGKVGVYVTTVIAYKTPFVVNGKPVTVSLDLGEAVT